MNNTQVLCEDTIDVSEWYSKLRFIYTALLYDFPLDWESIRKDHFNFEITEYNALHTIDITDYFLNSKEYFIGFLHKYGVIYLPATEWKELDAKASCIFRITDDDRIVCDFVFEPNRVEELRYTTQLEHFMEKMENEY